MLICFSLMTNANKEGHSLLSAASVNDWQFVSDRVMGGVSSGEVAVSLEGVTPLVQMSGEVSTANNDGFIQIRRDVSNLTAQGVSGVYLTVKGNREKLFCAHSDEVDSVAVAVLPSGVCHLRSVARSTVTPWAIQWV